MNCSSLLVARLLIVFVLLLVSACAKIPATTTHDPHRLWQTYTTTAGTKAPYRLDISLRFGAQGDTRRVTALLWGNDTENLRLDVMAGVGSLVAKIQSTPTNFLLVTPLEKKAYTHTGTNQPRLKLGLPLPLTLADLANLLTGSPAAVFGTQESASEVRDNGCVRYTVTGPLPGTLDLDSSAKPRLWRDKNWTMEMQYDESARIDKLTLTNTRNDRFLLFVRERIAPAPFTAEQLALQIPEGFRRLPLERYAKHHDVNP